MKYSTLWPTQSSFNDVSDGLDRPHMAYVNEENFKQVYIYGPEPELADPDSPLDAPDVNE